MFDVNLSSPIFFLIFLAFLFLFYVFLQWRIHRQLKTKLYTLLPQHLPSIPNQPQDVYNISSRVQGQNGAMHQWPTHEGRLSLTNFTISNETSKYADAPPSYDEALRLASPAAVLQVSPPVSAPKASSAPSAQ